MRPFDSERFRNQWIAALGDLRRELNFQILGYVLKPEHFHLLIWPVPEADRIMPKLKDRTALSILRDLRENPGHAWCRKMHTRITLPSTVHHHAHFRVWQWRFYDMNIWSPKKPDEKLNYLHNNPLKRGLAPEPGDWPWSSWRFYFRNDTSLLSMDRVL